VKDALPPVQPGVRHRWPGQALSAGDGLFWLHAFQSDFRRHLGRQGRF